MRHYTLNIDGLAEAVGMSTWHHERHPEGLTVEMHGNIRCGRAVRVRGTPTAAVCMTAAHRCRTVPRVLAPLHVPRAAVWRARCTRRQLVCPSCHAVEPLGAAHIATMRALQAVPCGACHRDALRFKIMLYDDDQVRLRAHCARQALGDEGRRPGVVRQHQGAQATGVAVGRSAGKVLLCTPLQRVCACVCSCVACVDVCAGRLHHSRARV